MPNTATHLVLVAHPGDETFAFSHVCAGADIVSVTGGVRPGLEATFRRVCELLGGKRALLLNLSDASASPLPIEALVERLRELGAYGRVYTHSPLDTHRHHREVALAASRQFDEIWVRAVAGYAAEAHVLSEAAFAQKRELVNGFYAEQITPVDDDTRPCVAEVLGVEAFVPTRFPEVVSALAYSGHDINTAISDLWAFQSSPYEQQRFERTAAVLAYAAQEQALTSVLEIGACEGTMTLRLRQLFPHATIRAVEVNPVFARRLRERLGDDAAVEIVEASILDIPLTADLVLLAEMLYFVPDHVMHILAQVKARYLLTSYFGSFDDRVSLCLYRYGWHNTATVQVPARFEPVDGDASRLIVPRLGTNIRLWKRPGTSMQSALATPVETNQEEQP